MPERHQIAVVIPAAGTSSRFAASGAPVSKLAAQLGGRSVLSRAVAAFLDRDDVGRVIVATRDHATTNAVLGDLALHAKLTLVGGSDSRAQTVAVAAKAVDTRYDLVAVHDGARPLVSNALISRVFDFARAGGAFRACAPALPIALTVKECQGPLPGKVSRTIPRQALWALQTPQVVPRQRFVEACEQLGEKLSVMTDDLQVLEAVGEQTWLVEGDERNIKITTRQDLSLAEELLAMR